MRATSPDRSLESGPRLPGNDLADPLPMCVVREVGEGAAFRQVCIQESPVGFRQEDNVRQSLQQRTVSRVALAQRSLGGHPVSQIDREDEHTIRHRLDAQPEPALAAVLEGELVVEPARLARRHHLAQDPMGLALLDARIDLHHRPADEPVDRRPAMGGRGRIHVAIAEVATDDLTSLEEPIEDRTRCIACQSHAASSRVRSAAAAGQLTAIDV